MSAADYKVLVLGLDGATFDLMLPWIDEGRLPCLKRLRDEGCHGPLRSTIPPITPCAWSSFMTGKNPGKHGLFDFVEPIPGDGRGFRFTNASSRHGESIWGYLSRHGRQVGVMNVPMTYPPEKVNGYLVSGLDTPHEHSQFMHPVSLKQELKAAGIRYRIDLQHLGNMRTDARRQRQLQEIFEGETERTRAFKHLGQKYPADFRMIVYGATDQVQHHFWHYMDPSHDKYDARGAAKFQHAIRDTYVHIDQLLTSILEDVDDDTVVIVMSDHGFGPTSNVRLRLNQVLEQADLLKFVEQRKTGHVKKGLARVLDQLLRRTLSSDLKRTIAGLFPRLRTWFESLDEADVDWARTSAYVNEAYRSSPAIWLNQQTESSPVESEQLRDKIEEILTLLVDPKTGEPVVNNVYRTRDVYHGPYSANAPDLLPSWWENGFLLEKSIPGGPADLMVERSTAPIEGGVEFAGSHRLDGVFMMAGGPVRRGQTLRGAQIIDVAPTVLYLMGHEIPADLDGKILFSALDPDFVAANPPSYADHDQSPREEEDQHHSFTPNESEMIARRLQALGYIE